MFGIGAREFEEIGISMISISIALLIADIGLRGLLVEVPFVETVKQLGVLIITVGAGFILHELAHKFVAQMYGAKAEFRMWPQGLAMMFLFALVFGFVFAAPGAVYIYATQISRKENGIISAAGPVTNMILAIIFLMFLPFAVINFGPKSIISEIALIGYSVNGILALFNLIPIFPLDGSKILRWNWIAWLAIAGTAAAIYVIPIIMFG